MERIAAVVAKLARILTAIGSGKGERADPLDLRKSRQRAARDAITLQASRGPAVDLASIDACIKSCLELLYRLDGARGAKEPDAPALAKHVCGLADCFPGFTTSDHVTRLAARLADARAVLEGIEAGRVLRPRDGELEPAPGGGATRKRGRATTLWDFVSDGGAAAERLAKERIERARARVGAAERAVDEAASTY
ncbi:MAG: hypothetical protein JW839_22315, partial [Candidatus Lokiarchaeota archaeon]|nr:hypothetical protein [Candidatus Lokiarchaeota archaeon]